MASHESGILVLVPDISRARKVSIYYYSVIENKWNNMGTRILPYDYRNSGCLLYKDIILMTGGVNEMKNTYLYSIPNSKWRKWVPMNQMRMDHTQTLLENGNVLVIGGAIQSSLENSVELYDFVLKKWNFVSPMPQPRAEHVAVLLENGEILVSGGFTQQLFNTSLSSCLIYSPSTDSWRQISSMNRRRQDHAMCLLPNGNVLVSGGMDFNGDRNMSSCEIYDIRADTWREIAPMNRPHIGHTMTLIGNKAIVIGGVGTRNINYTVEIYDYKNDTWVVGKSLPNLHLILNHMSVAYTPYHPTLIDTLIGML